MTETEAMWVARIREWLDAGCSSWAVPLDEIRVIADAMAERDARIEEALASFDEIKREALTAGAPGQRTTARALAHIVRLCINARQALDQPLDK